jgi:hypothetical protein
MMGRLTWALMAVALALPVGLYAMEHRVQALQDEVERYGRLLLDEQQAAHVLRAEWAHLNQPRRLQELVLIHEERLQLAPIGADQVARVADLPLRLAPPDGDGDGAPGVPIPAFKPLFQAAFTVTPAR